MSLRQRVNELKRTDPDFFSLMSEWRTEFNLRRKQWDDKVWTIDGYDIVSGKKTKIRYFINDACRMMWEQYVEDPEWNGEDGELVI